MTAQLLPNGKQFYESAAGLPLVGGKVFTYLAGTTTPAQTWVDANQVAANTNPIILDSRGECSAFWSGAYKVILKDALDNIIWTQDNATAADIGLYLTKAAAAATGGAALIGTVADGTVQDAISNTPKFSHAATYPASTIGKKLQDIVSIADAPYSAVGDGVADDGPAFQAAINAARSGQTIHIPAAPTNWNITSAVTVSKPLNFVGPNRKELIAISGAGQFLVTSGDVRFESIGFTGSRAASNKAVVIANGSGKLSMLDFYAEKFDVFCDIQGGYAHSFKSGEVRNMLTSTWKLDKNPGGVNGNDAFFDDILYDTDSGTYAQPVAVIDCLDFDAIVTSASCDFIRAGTTSGIYIHPVGAGGSSNHEFWHYMDTTTGAGIQISPTTPAFCTRTFIHGWASTCGRGVLIDGNGYAEITVKGLEAHHNVNEAVRFANTNAASALYVKGCILMSNNTANVGASDVDIGGVCLFYEVTDNTFGIGQGWTDQSEYFVNLGAGVIAGNCDRNTMRGTGRSGKINGLTAGARTSQYNSGFKVEATGQATITSGTNSVVINHGLDRTPGVEDVFTTYFSVARSTVAIRPTSATSTQITFTSDANASGGDCIFNWYARYLP